MLPNKNKLALYYYLSYLSKYVKNPQTDEEMYDVRLIGLSIPENASTLEFFSDINIQTLYEVEEIIPKMFQKLKIDNNILLKF